MLSVTKGILNSVKCCIKLLFGRLQPVLTLQMTRSIDNFHLIHKILVILKHFLAQVEMKIFTHKYTISYSHQTNPFKMLQVKKECDLIRQYKRQYNTENESYIHITNRTGTECLYSQYCNRTGTECTGTVIEQI